MLLLQGDLHVTDHIWSTQRDITGDARQGYDQVIDLGIQLFESGRINAIMLLGDLFDTINPRTELIRHVRQGIERCQAASLPVYYIDGNHDKRPTPWLNAVHDWPQYVGGGRPFQVVDGGPQLCALDYNVFDVVEGFCRELPECDALFLHQQCRQYMDIAGAWDFDLGWLPDRVRRVVMGHVHDTWDYDMGGGRSAHYTGSTHMRAIDQLYDKSSLLLNADLSVARLPLRSRPATAIAIRMPAEIEAIHQWLESVVDPHLPPVIHLTHPISLADDVRSAIAVCERHPTNPLFIRKQVSDIDDIGQLVDVRQARPSATAAELLPEVIDPQAYPESFRLVLDLIKEGNNQETTISETYQAAVGRRHQTQEC